jgi:acetolactate synthase-1/2/3 large subunit
MADSMYPNEGAEAFIESLNTHGVDRIFLNPGIDIVPLQGAVAKYRALGRKSPRIILCPHESVAVAAAHGAAMVSGKPQVVALFQDIGTLQAGGAIPNLRYGRMPVILCAGRNPTPNRVNWLEDPCDQRRLVRDYVKWDYEVRVDEDISSVLEEAFKIALGEPAGPVYLSIPRGALTGKVGQQIVSAPARCYKTVSSTIERGALAQAADILIAAENPLILTAYAGRHPEVVSPFVDLAETLGVRVITTDLRMNFPSTHPLCPGIDAIAGSSYDHYIAEADVLLLIDYDFPGPIGKRVAPAGDARIIHIDMEPLKNGKLLWGRKPDILIEGNSRSLLPALNEIIQEKVTGKLDSRFRDRFSRLANEHMALKEDWRVLARSKRHQRPVSSEWLCYCINEALDEDALLVHMIPSNADALSHQIGRSRPGTLYCWGDSAGSMGWALGAALGAKLVARDRLVVSLIGDGGFIYGCPVATLWSARAYNAPFLSIVFNNQSYHCIRQLVQMEFGDASVSGEMGFEVGTEIKDPPDFAAIGRACDAYGQRVEDPNDLPRYLNTAVAEVQRGKVAVLDVMV